MSRHAWTAPGGERYEVERDAGGIRFRRDAALMAFARDDLDGRIPLESQARNDALRELLSLAERLERAEERERWRKATESEDEPPSGEWVTAAYFDREAQGWRYHTAKREWWEGNEEPGSSGWVWESLCCDGGNLNDNDSGQPVTHWRELPKGPA